MGWHFQSPLRLPIRKNSNQIENVKTLTAAYYANPNNGNVERQLLNAIRRAGGIAGPAPKLSNVPGSKPGMLNSLKGAFSRPPAPPAQNTAENVNGATIANNPTTVKKVTTKNGAVTYYALKKSNSPNVKNGYYLVTKAANSNTKFNWNTANNARYELVNGSMVSRAKYNAFIRWYKGQVNTNTQGNPVAKANRYVNAIKTNNSILINKANNYNMNNNRKQFWNRVAARGKPTQAEFNAWLKGTLNSNNVTSKASNSNKAKAVLAIFNSKGKNTPGYLTYTKNNNNKNRAANWANRANHNYFWGIQKVGRSWDPRRPFAFGHRQFPAFPARGAAAAPVPPPSALKNYAAFNAWYKNAASGANNAAKAAAFKALNATNAKKINRKNNKNNARRNAVGGFWNQVGNP